MLAGVLCSASKPGDITGYSNGKDVWTPGASLKLMNLEGSEKVSEAGDKDCYFDPDRMIKFAGKDTAASVSLYFTRGRLATFTINVIAGEKSFACMK